MNNITQTRYDSVIFDVDGTLWDAVDSIAIGYSKASRILPPKYQKTFTRDQILRELGKPLDDIIRSLYKDVCEEMPEDTVHKIIKTLSETSIKYEIEAIIDYGARPYDYLIETLAELKKHIPLFIVSNCECGYIELFIEKTGTERFFDDHLCFADTGLNKDKTIAMMAEKHGLKRPCYLGDIENDAICSRLAGVDFIWASYGFGFVKEDLYVEKIDEFREITDVVIGRGL